MAEPFLSEIRIMSFNFPPKGWAFCNGQMLPINQNQALFALLGTTYGGNGQTTFALPNLQARVPIHTGAGHILGEAGGEKAHTLTVQELPTHPHVLSGTDDNGSAANPSGAVVGRVNNLYHAPSDLVSMRPESVMPTGGSQAHQNMQPFLVLSFCIALQGIFPSRN
jgi:microcystin-dependent protein